MTRIERQQKIERQFREEAVQCVMRAQMLLQAVGSQPYTQGTDAQKLQEVRSNLESALS